MNLTLVLRIYAYKFQFNFGVFIEGQAFTKIVDGFQLIL